MIAVPSLIRSVVAPSHESTRDAVRPPRLGRPRGVVAEPLGLLRHRDRLERARPRRRVAHVEAETHYVSPGRIGICPCDANAMTIADLRPTDEIVELRGRYRAFMEEHVYPNEPALDREDEAADVLVAELRAPRARAGAVGSAPAARGRRLERELPRLRAPERGDRPLALGPARLRLPGAGRRERRDPVALRHGRAEGALARARSSRARCARSSR